MPSEATNDAVLEEGPGVEGNDPSVRVEVDPASRPEGLPEKFQTMDEFVQAYNEMGKKIRDKFNLPEGYESPDQLLEEFNQLKESASPPEQYEIKLPEGPAELSEADVALFKELGLPNEKVQKLVDYVVKEVAPEVREARADAERDRLAATWNMSKEAPDFVDRLTAIKQWADQNLPETVVKELSTTASGVRALFNLMQAGYEKRATPGRQEQSTPGFGLVDIQSRVNDDRYWNDAAFRVETERMMNQLHKM